MELLRKYQDLGHMEEEFDPQISCLPHHGVFRADKALTKLRVVFNGSSPTSTGISFNEIFLKGKIAQ